MLALTQHCPECRSFSLEHDDHRGEVICLDCGLVLDDKMIKVEIPFKSDEDGKMGRDGVGSKTTNTQVNSGTATSIGNYSDFNKLTSKEKWKFRRLKQWQNRTSNSIERNLNFALAELKRVSSKLQLRTREEEEAARLYKEAAYKGFARGRPMEVMVSAAIYMACRYHEIPVGLSEISKVYDGVYTKKDIGRTYRVVARGLGLRFMPQHPGDYIPKICTKLKLSAKSQTQAVEFLEKTERLSLMSGRGPRSIAAAVVYISGLVNGQKRIQKDVAEASGITEVTLRNRYQELVTMLGLMPKRTKSSRITTLYKENKIADPLKAKKFKVKKNKKSKPGRPKKHK